MDGSVATNLPRAVTGGGGRERRDRLATRTDTTTRAREDDTKKTGSGNGTTADEKEYVKVVGDRTAAPRDEEGTWYVLFGGGVANPVVHPTGRE